MDNDGGLSGESFQQILIVRCEGLRSLRINIENAAHLAFDFKGNGQFRAYFRSQHDVSRVAGDIANARRPARPHYPSSDALAEAELGFAGFGWEPLGSENFEESGGRIKEHD